MPPIPAPQITPTLLKSIFEFNRFESLIASSEQIVAYCENLSCLRISFFSIKSTGLKFFNSHANLVLKSDVSK